MNGINSLKAQAPQLKAVQKPEEKTSQENKNSMKTSTKVMIGAGLAALAAAGIYIATRGKGKVSAEQINQSVEHLNQPIENLNQPVEQLKKMTINSFKEAGNKFVKGKALTSTGEGYTGTLTHTEVNGSTLSMEYVDGLLQKSKGCKKVDSIVEPFVKEYVYDADNHLKAVKDGNRNITAFHSNGKLRFANNDGYRKFYGEDGKLICEIGSSANIRDYTIKYPDGRTVNRYDDPKSGANNYRHEYHNERVTLQGDAEVDIIDYAKVDRKGEKSSVFDISDGIWNLSRHAGRNSDFAKYNSKTQEITVLDTSITKNEVQSLVDTVKEHLSLRGMHDETVKRMLNEYYEVKNSFGR